MSQDGNIVESFQAKVLQVTSDRPCLKSLCWGVQFNWDIGVKAHQGIKRPLFSTSGHTSLPPVGELRWDTRSAGMVFSGCGIWPKYSAGFGKTQNFLTGYGIRPLLGKWDSPNSWHCMRYWERKTLFGMEMTEVRDAWLSWKRSWNAGSRPLF